MVRSQMPITNIIISLWLKVPKNHTPPRPCRINHWLSMLTPPWHLPPPPTPTTTIKSFTVCLCMQNVMGEGVWLNYDVSVFILNPCTAAQSNGDIRLAGNSGNDHSGRLEIFLNKAWGTVCYDTVSPGAAQAACRQLGYSDYEAVDTVANMGWVWYT